MLHFALLTLVATAIPGPTSAAVSTAAATPPVAPSATLPGSTSAAVMPPAPVGRIAATPAFLTAGELQRKCQDKALAAVSYCYAYVTGVHDAVKAYETWLNMREFCRPLRMSQSELRQAFLEYMQQNPLAATGEAASVVVVALRQKYACDGTIAPASP